jgi:hypothetical protein
MICLKFIRAPPKAKTKSGIYSTFFLVAMTYNNYKGLSLSRGLISLIWKFGLLNFLRDGLFVCLWKTLYLVLIASFRYY